MDCHGQNCTACLMPFAMDDGKRTSDQFCSYCQNDQGEFAFQGTKAEFKKTCYEAMKKKGIPAWKARFFTFMINFAPYWKQAK